MRMVSAVTLVIVGALMLAIAFMLAAPALALALSGLAMLLLHALGPTGVWFAFVTFGALIFWAGWRLL